MKLKHLCVSLQEEEVILQNPADVLVYVQVLPLALLPNPSVFTGKLADRWEISNDYSFFFFFPSSLHLALTVIFSDFISQVAIRKFVQHQHWHKYLRVSGSQKSSECCKSDVHHYSGIQRISWLAYNCIAVLLFVAEAACGSCLSLTGSLFSWQTSLMKSSTGFVEGSTRPFVYNLLLQPGEVKSFSVRFTPISNHSVSSLLIVR